MFRIRSDIKVIITELFDVRVLQNFVVNGHESALISRQLKHVYPEKMVFISISNNVG